MKIIIILLTLFTNACANTVQIGNDNYSFVNSNTGASTLNTAPSYSHTLKNNRTGQIATITGNLVVELNGVSAKEIATRYGLKIVNNFTHINTVFFNTLGQNVFEVKANMDSDSDIKRVRVDLIENIRTAH